MKWSWKVGKLAGIDVYIHATFALLLMWVALSHWMMGGSVASVAVGVGFMLSLFACVLLHELGHALAARRYGIQTRDITLLPIGGLARLERMPEEPKQELWVALAGPAVNVAIAAVLYLWLTAVTGWVPWSQLSMTDGPFLERLLLANVILVLFNLIPAFPMDGGRALRALLATRMSFPQATRVAAGLGQGLAFVFALVGLFSNPFLMFIALFVWIGAAQESEAAQMRPLLTTTRVSAAMLTDFRELEAGDDLAKAVRLVIDGSQHDFPVVEDGHVTGILTRSDLVAALAEHGPEAPVNTVARRKFDTADPYEMLDAAFRRLQESECPVLPVVEQGRLVGLLTAENVAEFVMLRNAIGEAARPRARASLVQRPAISRTGSG